MDNNYRLFEDLVFRVKQLEERVTRLENKDRRLVTRSPYDLSNPKRVKRGWESV